MSVRSLQSLLGTVGDGPSDADLLARFVRNRDQVAFELLAWRHSRLVFRVCRAVLGDHHAAEDAFQATFLALARNAAVVGRHGTVAGWLYRVARRVAARALRRAVRCRTLVSVPPGDLSQVPAPAPSPVPDPETTRLLHEELDRLPERYREPLLLCYLEGLTQAEAARRLGWPIGTVATRLTRAKERLGRRLVRRGIAVPAAGVTVLFTGYATAGDPCVPSFVRDTAGAAVRYAEGQSVPGVSRAVLHMACEVNKMSTMKFLWAAGVLAASLAIAGVSVASSNGGPHSPEAEPRDGRPTAKPAPAKDAPAKVGRLAFVGDGRIASIRPDGTDLTWHTPEWAPGPKSIDLNGPRFDPTGKRVAYGIENGETTSVYIRALEGDAPEIDLSVKGKTWCWSPDGKRLAVSAVEKPAMEEPTTWTVVVNIETKKVTEVKLPPGHLVTDWSPDGAWFLTASPSYIQPITEMPRVTVMKTDGTAARRLSAPKEASYGGRFSPDGKTVVFSTFDYVTREGRLYTTNVVGGAIRPAGRALRTEITGACWSPDGKRIAAVWRRNYAKPEKDQKAEFLLLVTDPNGENETTVRKVTGQIPADEGAPFQLNWVSMSGLDWR